MMGLGSLVHRNSKLFFKDKGIFFTSLATPLILLVLYATFLGNVYKDSMLSAIPPTFSMPEQVIDGIVGGQLLSSLLAVSCVTVSFCANMLMVQDKVNGSRWDLTVTPVKSSTLALSYYIATAISTIIISLVATGACFLYLSVVGWYLSVGDVLYLLLDVILVSLFGTALSSLINFFLSSQGQISALGSIVSAGYGFICGAYMPISSFSQGLQQVISFLPGTYATSLFRNHALQGAFAEMEALGTPPQLVVGLQESVDCRITFFDHTVSQGAMYGILVGSIILCVVAYILVHKFYKTKQ